MNYRQAYNIEDLRRLAQQRLPRVAFEFLDRGTEDEVTLRDNRADFERIRFMPRALVDVSARSQKVEVFGKTFNTPFGIAPTGAAGLYCFDGGRWRARQKRRAAGSCPRTSPNSARGAKRSTC